MNPVSLKTVERFGFVFAAATLFTGVGRESADAQDAPRQIAIPTADGQPLSGDLYGSGEHGVVILAHGGYSSRKSWTKQAEMLVAEGFRVLVVESRAATDLAAGKETPCLYDEVCQAKDVLVAVRHLRQLGARTISLIGGSMGGGAVAQASVEAQANEIERIVLLAPATIAAPEKMAGRKLFVTTRNDANDAGPRLPGIQAQYARTPEPKQLVLLEGSAHAQRIFLTPQGDAVMRDIVRFLKAPPAPLDVVLVGGRVLDPETNLDAVRTVGIGGGRIVSVTTAVPAARDTVDVRGLVVAPGFIDLHSHGQDSLNYRYLAHDGVTTALELELGTYPVAPWYAKREGKSLINFGVSASHPGARRAMLDGDSTAEAADIISATGAFVRSPIERARLLELERRLDAALKQGALGIGMGINYTPAATREEILRAFAVAARHHAPVFVHLRSAGLLDNAGGVAGIQEVIADAAATGASLHVVHVTSMGLGATPVLLDLIDGARARGLDVTTEAYPYTAGATMLQSAIFDPGFRERMGIDYKDIMWAANGERLTAESFERYRKQGGLVIVFSIPESAADQAYHVPHVMVASDGGFLFRNGVPIGHPRSAGTHARILGRFVRERGVLSLMDGVRKMTLLPARRLERVDPDMKRKGRVQPGADADLVVFDPARVIDRATFEQPAQYSDGIVHVLVNGIFVVRGSNLVPGVAPGRPVRGR